MPELCETWHVYVTGKNPWQLNKAGNIYPAAG